MIKPDYRSFDLQKECNDFLGAFLCCAEELQDIIMLDGKGGVKG